MNFTFDSLPTFHFFIGGYSGSHALGRVRQGLLLAYTYNFREARYCDGREYFKWQFAADYASGKNANGGGGFALMYYFTPDITIQMGPTFFNSARFNGKWKWSVFLVYNFPVFKPSHSK